MREIICCFTLCLKKWGRQSVVETKKWEGDGDWGEYEETEKWEEWDEDWETYVGKKKIYLKTRRNYHLSYLDCLGNVTVGMSCLFICFNYFQI